MFLNTLAGSLLFCMYDKILALIGFWLLYGQLFQ